ncbi:MAG: N-acetylmuramic acid 6-phosphate etherase [bacterium]|nr:N-acetylmuramic acid 6-phosphate etherase [bacterium]
MAHNSRWADLLTEQRNPASQQIDAVSTLDALKIINREDQAVPQAVAKVLDEVARAVDIIVDAFQQGGRLFYVGAGTSGRLGVLDAAECPPTFGSHPEQVQGIIAGGSPALVRSQEGAEDRPEDGAVALQEKLCTAKDVVMGIAASGVTPFVLGALREARSIGCAVLFFSCNPSAAQQVDADVRMVPVVGPEVIAGSTRMKAGTATKLILNMITTTAMIQMGKVYENLMVDLTPSCEKLQDRAERILTAFTGLDQPGCRKALLAADHDLKTAVVMTKRAVSKETARRLLKKNGNIVRKALEA